MVDNFNGHKTVGIFCQIHRICTCQSVTSSRSFRRTFVWSNTSTKWSRRSLVAIRCSRPTTPTPTRAVFAILISAWPIILKRGRLETMQIGGGNTSPNFYRMFDFRNVLKAPPPPPLFHLFFVRSFPFFSHCSVDTPPHSLVIAHLILNETKSNKKKKFVFGTEKKRAPKNARGINWQKLKALDRERAKRARKTQSKRMAWQAEDHHHARMDALLCWRGEKAKAFPPGQKGGTAPFFALLPPPHFWCTRLLLPIAFSPPPPSRLFLLHTVNQLIFGITTAKKQNKQTKPFC